MKSQLLLFVIAVFIFSIQTSHGQEREWEGKFEQLEQEIPTPNTYRAADGAPGPDYWQQRADYDLSVRLNDQNQDVLGSGTITYYNQSPNNLDYLWLQLDQNRRASHSDDELSRTFQLQDSMWSKSAVYNMQLATTQGGIHIHEITDTKDKPLSYTINKTMMRIDLPKTLKPGKSIKNEQPRGRASRYPLPL